MKNALISFCLLVAVGCSSDQQSAATSAKDMQVNVIGEWQYAGNYGEDPGARIPGFLKEHGYIFTTDGKWKARVKPTGFASHLTGEYTLNGDQLTMTGKSIIGGSRDTRIKFENGGLIMLSDITISRDDKQSQTRYKRVQ